MDIFLNIAALLWWSWLLWMCYRQGKLLKLREQIIEHLEWQVDRCAALATERWDFDVRHAKDAPVVRLVAHLAIDMNAARKQRDYLMKLVTEYKAKYGDITEEIPYLKP